MKAWIQSITLTDEAFSNWRGGCAFVEIESTGKGLYATPSQRDAEMVVEAVNEYWNTKVRLEGAIKERDKLADANRKLRRKLKERSGK